MALATTCPECKTSFKVVPDQLKLRRGLVRCGLCQHVFSGIDYISQVLPLKAPKPEISSGDDDSLHTAFFIPDTVLAPTTQMMIEQLARENYEPIEDFRVATPPSSIQLRGANKVHEDEHLIAKGTPKSSLFEPHDKETEAVDFFSGNQDSGRPKILGTRSGVMLALGIFLLTLGLVAQSALISRDSLAARFPAFAPVLENFAQSAGLKIDTVRNLDALTIESFELQNTFTPGLFAVAATLKNSVAYNIKWPAIELTLTDSVGTIVLRKVLLPADYLSSSIVPSSSAGVASTEKNGFKSKGELPIKLALEVNQLNPTGFSAALFYP